MLSVIFQSGCRDTLAEVSDAFISLDDSSPDFPNTAFNVRIVWDENFEEYLPWSLTYLTSKEDRESSVLHP